MKIGYPCINRSIECQGDKTFRLASYSEERIREVVGNNLQCLTKMLEYNREHAMFFFRISSVLVPFASHPVCTFPWQKVFKAEFRSIGEFIKKHEMRISMHPDQFTLINSIDEDIFGRSVKELSYHAEVLDLLGLDISAKIQIHVGGVYGDKPGSIERFIKRYKTLPNPVLDRLVIENDERCYSVQDCMEIHKATDIPVLFDVFHDSILGSGKSVKDIIKEVSKTWRKKDGILMVDYSSQQRSGRPGAHTQSIDVPGFSGFLRDSRPFDFDVMLEIKDKEVSALKAIIAASKDKRFLL